MMEIEKKVEPLLKDLKEKAQRAIATVPAAKLPKGTDGGGLP